MADGADLLRFELPRTRTTIEADGSGLAREQRPFRQHQMDAGGLDAVDGADGAGEFALQRAQMVDVLDEARGAERVGLVENLVADAAALGQVAFGQLHPQPRDLVLRHHDDRAFVAQLERNRLALQILDDAGEGSSVGRSVNRVVICGVVTRMMTKAKKPISAVVTATMAISLDAPRPLRKATRLCTNRPRIRPQGPTGQLLPRDGFHMVNNR